METKHSDGPWVAIRSQGGLWFVNSRNGNTVCDVRTAPAFKRAVAEYGKPTEAQANARLIAAAPEMFALLEEMVNTAEWEEGSERVMNTNNAKLYKLMGGTARALLAKVNHA